MEDKKRRAFLKSLVGFVFFGVSGCNNNYIKALEEIVVNNKGTLEKELNKEEILEREKIPFKHFERYLVVNNERLHLDVYESEKAFSNIILLPTLGEPACSLSCFSNEIASYGYNVYTLDVRGFGKSSGGKGEIDVRKAEKDISTTIDYVVSRNNKRIVLAGTSMGSEYSLLYSAEGQYKERLDAVIAHGSFVPSADVPDLDVRVGFCKNPLNKPLVEVFSGGKLNILETLGKEKFYNNTKELKQITEDSEQRDYVVSGDYIDFLNYKPENPVNSYKGPLLLIVSKDDKMICFKHSIYVFNFLKKKNPDAVLYIPQGEETRGEVPHMAFDTNYKEVSKDINRFLKKVLN
jgi:pimeloyl-ACP methyl ester carboxylesterase